MDAKEAVEISERKIKDNLYELIASTAEKGLRELDLSLYDYLYLTEEWEEELVKKGYKVSTDTISW